MILLIDNYDSFTYNLAQYLGELGAEVRVVRNDEIGVPEIIALGPAGVVLSPGPGTPADSGVCLDLLREGPADLPILGVCLGHQALGQVCGARVVRASRPIHGQVWPIHIDEAAGDPLLLGLPSPFAATRYHSLVVDPASLPPCLLPSAWTAEGELMAMRHRHLPRFGVQFHPESIGSEHGHHLLASFLRQKGC